MAFWVSARVAAEEEVIALAHSGHGVLMGGGSATGPAGDVLVEDAVIVPGFWGGGLEQGTEAKAFEFLLEFSGEFRSGVVA